MFGNANVGQKQPFGKQIDRDSQVLQRSAQFPLKSVSKEEEFFAMLTALEQENEQLKSANMLLQRRLDSEQRDHYTTQEKLKSIQGACRRLTLANKVQYEEERFNREMEQNGRNQAQNGSGSHLLSTRERDIRVHGGSGHLNQFAFGSDQLQKLISEHQSGEGCGYGRKSRVAVLESPSKQSHQQEHQQFKRMSTIRSENQSNEDGQFDVLGNRIQVHTPIPQQNQEDREEDQEHTIFSGMGKNKRPAMPERTGTDLRSNQFLSQQKLWRNSN
uniref:Uncharacterized protein n=1 Tax=Mucochytrium quahogii TaxID=96639 RepID=A0A7S2WSG0_9STRA|mmetsp:Transcript_7687/g.16813  ORF Transcript_7687/g.16813 Transcript_7687/m.16813 type:complete len:273 (+) Transcript_7687:307-1125(+)